MSSAFVDPRNYITLSQLSNLTSSNINNNYYYLKNLFSHYYYQLHIIIIIRLVLSWLKLLCLLPKLLINIRMLSWIWHCLNSHWYYQSQLLALEQTSGNILWIVVDIVICIIWITINELVNVTVIIVMGYHSIGTVKDFWGL